jgi:hypothetical protein
LTRDFRRLSRPFLASGAESLESKAVTINEITDRTNHLCVLAVGSSEFQTVFEGEMKRLVLLLRDLRRSPYSRIAALRILARIPK